MGKLLDIHKNNFLGLQQKSSSIMDANKILDLLQEEINTLQNVCMDKLTPAQTRTALPMLEVLKVSFSAITTIYPYNLKESKQKQQVNGFNQLIEWLRNLISTNETFHNDKSYQTEKREPVIDAENLLKIFFKAVEAIDEVVDNVSPKHNEELLEKEQKKPLEQDLVVLEFLQNLLGDALTEDSKLLLKRSKEIPSILKRYGISYRVYDSNNKAESNEEDQFLFDFEPDITAKIYETIVPAFVKGERVLLKGRVTKPIS